METEGLTALIVRVAGQTLAIEIGQVQALRRKETLYPAREGPPDLQGFLRWGEQAVVPVLDLGSRLGLQEARKARLGFLVVTAQRSPLAFRVDRVEETITVSWDRTALLPELLQQLQSRPIVWGLLWGWPAGQTGRRELVPLLDLGKIVTPEEAAALDRIGQDYRRRSP